MHDIKFKTSLFNHGAISDGHTPLISNADYVKVLQAVRNGDLEAYTEAKALYCFEPKQQKMIEDIINGRVV